jgi:hypothetical protein
MMRDHSIGFVCLGLLCLIVATPAKSADDKKTCLIVDDLSTWRTETGAWCIVGEGKMEPANNARIATRPGTGVLVNGLEGRTSNLLSKAEHGDVVAHIEFMVPKGSNSGVYFQGRYEVQILDSFGVEKPKYGDCGGIYRAADFAGTPPRVNASRPPGQWQTYDVIFRGPRFDNDGKKITNAKFIEVKHNGVVVHENVEVPRPTIAATFSDEKPTGPLMLQGDHGPVAYRNIWWKTLNDEVP